MLSISDIPNLGELRPARCWVYALVDPRNGEVRYIGSTQHIRSRTREHLGGFSVANMVQAWMKSLRQSDLKPVVYLLEEITDRANRREIEMRWINLCLSQGANLLNTILYRPSSQIVREAVKAELDRLEGKIK